MAYNSRNLSHSPGSQKSEIKVSRTVFSLKTLGKDLFFSFHSFWWWPTIRGLQLQHSSLCFCHHMAFPLCVMSKFPTLIKAPDIVYLRPTLVQYGFLLTQLYYNDPISSHRSVSQVLERHEFEQEWLAFPSSYVSISFWFLCATYMCYIYTSKTTTINKQTKKKMQSLPPIL